MGEYGFCGAISANSPSATFFVLVLYVVRDDTWGEPPWPPTRVPAPPAGAQDLMAVPGGCLILREKLYFSEESLASSYSN